MHHRIRGIAAPFLVAGLVAACSQAPTPAEDHVPPAEVEAVAGSDISRLTLTERAAERLDIQTAAVAQSAGVANETSIPYSAILYAPDGVTWIYVSPEPLTYLRELVVVDRIEGEVAVLSGGPAVDTEVVTVGVAELYGTEFEVGH